ncbi:PHP domain-containing protein [Maledivibacter halophilus]|uniref:PHP domain-containing protein n=1 Tax=Maledivibacter halophilus TaxID=36842 RepID=A0A1T5M1M6_9FIRM|nr:PHP domain-containing protein [Maledivibacter halophilus]SKC81934.1 PHP domain-containing protein [Maledivibacter halophilus]
MFGKIADLHIHSFYSDGTMSPEEILIEASNKDVGLLAITDHDILDGSVELMKFYEKYDIKCISGVEIDVIDNGINYHILGYGVNLEDEEFCDFIKQNRILLEAVNIKLIEKMQHDYDCITLPDYLRFTYDKTKGGWKALHYFIEKGLTKSLFEGFMLYSKYEHSYNCVQFPSIKLACKYIHNAGGKAVLAHPGKVIKETNIDSFKNEVLRTVDLGIDGIECYYPSHIRDITNVCLEICEERNLLITCGSDCHGEFEDTEIGEMNIPIEKLKLGDIFSR